MCCLINHVYMYSFRSTIEATEKLNSNLVIFRGVGAFEQLLGPVRGEFEQKFSKNSNAGGGVARGEGMLKLRFDWYIKLRFRDGLVWTVGQTVEIKLRFRDGLVWTVGQTVEIKLRFHISPA